MLAKAPEIVLFQWSAICSVLHSPATATPGALSTPASKSTELEKWRMASRTAPGGPALHARPAVNPDALATPGANMAAVAGYSLSKVNAIAGKLGKPIGIASLQAVPVLWRRFPAQLPGHDRHSDRTAARSSRPMPKLSCSRRRPPPIRPLSQRSRPISSRAAPSSLLQGCSSALEGKGTGKGIEQIVELHFTGNCSKSTSIGVRSARAAAPTSERPPACSCPRSPS